MASEEKLGSTKRFGARYGRTVKERFAKIEKKHRGLHKCPYCNMKKVKRQAVGIWQCGKCSAKFAGKAYTFKRHTIISSEELEEIPEQELEEIEETEKQEEKEKKTTKKEEES